jgi:hypothetical protein
MLGERGNALENFAASAEILGRNDGRHMGEHPPKLYFGGRRSG